MVFADMGITRLISHHLMLLTSILLSMAKVVVEYIDMERPGRLIIAIAAAMEGDTVATMAEGCNE
jgi:hypothetical protein